MKKVYAMMGIAVAISFSASAFNLSNRSLGFENAEMTLQSRNELKVAMPTKENPLKASAKETISTRASVPGGMAGVYYLMWADTETGAFQDGGFQIIVNSDGKTGIISSINQLANLNVNIDEAAGTISIPNQSIGEKFSWSGKGPDGEEITDNILPRFQHYIVNTQTRRLEASDEPLVFTYQNDGTFVPKNGDIDVFIEEGTLENHPSLSLSWSLPSAGFDMILYKYPEKLDNTGWQNIGEATIVDNFMTEGGSWTCPVQKSLDQKDVYRLVNPYGGVFSNVKYLAEGEIRFDAGCPTAPMIMFGPKIFSGIVIEEVAPDYGWPASSPLSYYPAFSTYASDFYYTQDFEGDDVFTKEEIGEEFGEDECGSIKGNVITFGGLVSSVSVNMGLFAWGEEEGSDELYASKFIITMPDGWKDNSGVNEIGSDNVNAPVKFFNLQGMEIANPEAGQIVIKKQGTKIVKVIAE